jgi:site-specific DNA-methyltransferase (adenine-specific)
MGGHYTTAASQPAIMTREHLEQCRHLLGDVPEWVEREADMRSVESRNFAEREVVGVSKNAMSGWSSDGSTQYKDRDITTPATPEAQQWAGWGTALKPALEPITMARKPLAGTVAACVLQHGTGALNVDGCRVGAAAGDEPLRWEKPRGGIWSTDSSATAAATVTTSGRWPANLIHDGSDEVVGLFPEQQSGARCAGTYYGTTGSSSIGDHGAFQSDAIQANSGSAARFFYTAKATKAERQGVTHPTVKPLDLMAYLCRLVTPPGGIVLDPFMGSGTTIKAALSEGFNAIGIERDPAYFAMAEHRMDGAQLGLGLCA